MVVDVRWAPRARDDLLDIYVVVGLADPLAAEKYMAALEAKAHLLSENPRLGRCRPDLREDARMLVETPYVILYRLVADGDAVDHIEIIRVLDGRRDLEKLLGP